MPQGQGVSTDYQASMSVVEAGKYGFRSQLRKIFSNSKVFKTLPCLEGEIVKL